MATVTSYTAAKMEEILGEVIVSFSVSPSNHLILHKRNGDVIDGGLLPAGPEGPPGDVNTAQLDAAILASETARGFGLVKQDTVGTNQSIGFAADTWTDVDGLSITWPPLNDRWYEFSFDGIVSALGDDEVAVDGRIVEGSSNNVVWGSTYCLAEGHSYSLSGTKKVHYSGSGSKTYKMQIRASVPTEVQLRSATIPTTMAIVDLGNL